MHPFHCAGLDSHQQYVALISCAWWYSMCLYQWATWDKNPFKPAILRWCVIARYCKCKDYIHISLLRLPYMNGKCFSTPPQKKSYKTWLHKSKCQSTPLQAFEQEMMEMLKFGHKIKEPQRCCDILALQGLPRPQEFPFWLPGYLILPVTLVLLKNKGTERILPICSPVHVKMMEHGRHLLSKTKK